MRTIGHGIDLVDVSRISRLIADHPDQFLDRCFTAAERAYAFDRPSRTAEHLAARFAAKEAVLKALGTGLTGGIAWTDIEVIRGPDGRPSLSLTGDARAHAARLGIDQWFISLTHTEAWAMASVIATSTSH